jgi:methionyl-tRNA synthetase
VDVAYFLSKYDPDALRYDLTATIPETRDPKACPEEFKGFAWRLSSATTTSGSPPPG